MPLIHAHRGASAYAPENTLPSFRKAVELHSDGVENDIHLTLDNQWVVCHDDDIARTSNGQGCSSQMTLGQLRQYDFGSKFALEFAGTPIPTLEEFLQVVSDMNPINIEIKGPFREDTDLKEAFSWIYTLLEKYRCVDRTLFSSFGHEWLGLLKEQYPHLRTGLLYGDRLTPEATLELVGRFHADAIHPYLPSIDETIVQACHENGVEINAWTINSPEDIQRAIDLGIDGIITDVPDKVREALERN